MKTKTKTIGLLAGTLLIGIVLGAFLHSLFIRQTVRRMSHKWRKPDFFIERFEDLLQPSEHQKEDIETILKKHHDEMIKLRRRMPVLFDSLRSDLKGVLNDEQQKMLDDHFNKINKESRKRSSHRHPNRDTEKHRPPDVPSPSAKEPI